MSKWFVSFATLAMLANSAAADSTVATVGSRKISASEVEKRIKPKLVEIETERYDAMTEGLDSIIEEELIEQEAKARKVTPEALVDAEVTSKVKEPTADEAKALYEQHKSEIQGTFEQVQPQIMQYIKRQQAAGVHEQFIAGLRKKYSVTVSLEPPLVEVGTGGRPVKGNKNAKVMIISFSDYECPFCKRAEPTVEQVVKAYGDKIGFVHRDFPLEFHQRAKPAAVAAHCAESQGKFWEYHAKLFASEDLSDAKLKALAKELGLDQAAFDKCLASDQFNAAIDKDTQDGAEVGVNGTPAFFINGRMLSGAQPFEKFKEVIDAELARK